MIKMKQVTNSLLTLYSIRSTAAWFAKGLPRGEVSANGRILTPFHVHRKEKQLSFSILPGRSCPPRNFIPTRLGEGSIRSLLQTITLALIAAVCLLSISSLYGAGMIQVRLKGTVPVKPGKVLLKDIALFEGEDAGLINKIGRIPIMDAPDFGTVKTLSRHQIEEIIRRSRDDTPEIRTSGAPIVQVLLKSRQITADEIVPVLRTYVTEKSPWSEQEIEIYALGKLEKIEVPTGSFDLRISDKSPVFGREKLLVSFDVARKDNSLTSFWLTVGIRVKARVLIAEKSIPHGKKIDTDDVIVALTEIKDLDAACMRDPSEAIGQIAKRRFSPGDPLTREALMKPFLVKSGDTVHLRLERNGLVLTSLARAEQDGRLGQVIRVRNLEFSSVLKARVTGRAQVEMP